MKLLGSALNKIFSAEKSYLTKNEQIHREWDRQRARAMSPSERDEIDAIFSRAL